jgi:hypothetical protein
MLPLILATPILTSPDLRPSTPVPKAFLYGECGGADRALRRRWRHTGRHGFAGADRARPGRAAARWLDPLAGLRHSGRHDEPERGAAARRGRRPQRLRRDALRRPVPPPGPAHRCVFRLDALDARLPLSADTSYEQYQHLRSGHVLASGVLETSYDR